MLNNYLKILNKFDLLIPYVFAFLLKEILPIREYFIILSSIYFFTRYKEIINKEIRLKVIFCIVLNLIISVLFFINFEDMWIISSLILSFVFTYFLGDGIFFLIYPFLLMFINIVLVFYIFIFLPFSYSLVVIV